MSYALTTRHSRCILLLFVRTTTVWKQSLHEYEACDGVDQVITDGGDGVEMKPFRAMTV